MKKLFLATDIKILTLNDTQQVDQSKKKKLNIIYFFFILKFKAQVFLKQLP